MLCYEFEQLTLIELYKQEKPPSKAKCYICKKRRDDSSIRLIRDCDCMISKKKGWVHLPCLFKRARQITDIYEDITNTSQAPPLTDKMQAQDTLLEPWTQCNICKYNFFEKLGLLMALEYSRAYDHHILVHPLRFYSKLLLCQLLFDNNKIKECEELCESELKKIRNMIRLNGYGWSNERCLALWEMELDLLMKMSPIHLRNDNRKKMIDVFSQQRALVVHFLCLDDNELLKYIDEEEKRNLRYLQKMANADVYATERTGENNIISNDLIQSLDYCRKIYEESKDCHGKCHIETLIYLRCFIEILEANGKIEEALLLLRDAMKDVCVIYGERASETRVFEYNLAKLEKKVHIKKKTGTCPKESEVYLVTATIVKIPKDRKVNGRYVQVLKAHNDGIHYIVAIDLDGKQSKFKALPENLLFTFNTKVTFQGLEKKRELNGQKGIIIGFSEKNMRYAVELIETSIQKKVEARPKNLRVLFE